jgi:phosphatidylglycerophosphate synthase
MKNRLIQTALALALIPIFALGILFSWPYWVVTGGSLMSKLTDWIDKLYEDYP